MSGFAHSPLLFPVAITCKFPEAPIVVPALPSCHAIDFQPVVLTYVLWFHFDWRRCWLFRLFRLFRLFGLFGLFRLCKLGRSWWSLVWYKRLYDFHGWEFWFNWLFWDWFQWFYKVFDWWWCWNRPVLAFGQFWF